MFAVLVVAVLRFNLHVNLHLLAQSQREKAVEQDVKYVQS